MVTIKSYRAAVRPGNRAPTPKRKPARLSAEVAHFRGRVQKKAKSR